jgi:hypothetical protein
VHPNQISQWKQEFVENSQKVFSWAVGKEKEEEVNLEALYAKIRQLEMKPDFLKNYEEERYVAHRRQCQLLSISQASFYYSPRQEKA